MNMAKVPSFRFQQCLGPFTMLLVEGFSEPGLFRDLSNYVFGRTQFQKDIDSESHLFFFKCSKFKVDFTDPERNGDNVCCFFDNSICIGCVILSLLGGEYLSSTVSVLTNSRKILYSTKRGYFQLNYLHSVHKMSQRCCHPDCSCVLTRWPCCLLKGTLKEDFLDVYLITF